MFNRFDRNDIYISSPLDGVPVDSSHATASTSSASSTTTKRSAIPRRRYDDDPSSANYQVRNRLAPDSDRRYIDKDTHAVVDTPKDIDEYASTTKPVKRDRMGSLSLLKK